MWGDIINGPLRIKAHFNTALIIHLCKIDCFKQNLIFGFIQPFSTLLSQKDLEGPLKEFAKSWMAIGKKKPFTLVAKGKNTPL